MYVEDIPSGRIYHDLAHLVPLLTPPGDYVEEAGHWRDVLFETLGPGKHEILELGVGGGHNLSHLTKHFKATAVDVSEPMLALCRDLNPGVELHLGDMRSVRLGRTFSAVLIHDAIGYMLTVSDLAAAFATAAAHLKPGGVFITAPDYLKETFHGPQVAHCTRGNGDMELTYIEYAHDPDPDDSTMEMLILCLIREKGKRVRLEHDRHVIGLFPKAVWIDQMRIAGFTVETRSFFLHKERRSYELLVGTFG